MKKLNKLLMPVVGLSTIAATAIPLAACSKYVDGVEVNEKEWEEAFAYLAASKEGATWKSSLEDTFQVFNFDDGDLSEFAEYYDMAFNDSAATMKAVGVVNKEVDVSELVSIEKNNMYFSYTKQGTDWKCELDRLSIMQEYLIMMIEYIGGINEYKFDKDSKAYLFNDLVEVEEFTGYSNSSIRFDSNKKITYLNYHTVLFDNDGNPALIVNTVLHPIYNNVTVTVPSELAERANKHVIDVPTSGKITLPTTDPNDAIIGNLTSSGEIKTITVKDAQTTPAVINNLRVNGIYVNDKIIFTTDEAPEGADNSYTFDNTTGTITFTKKLAKDDKISIGLHNFDNATGLTFTLA